MNLLNVGSAILILGSIYMHLIYNLDVVVTVFLCVVGLATWAYHGFSDERKALFKAQAKYYNAKAKYYDEKGKLNLSFGCFN